MKKYRCARCGAKIAKEEVKGGRVRCGVCGCVGAVNAAGIVVTLYGRGRRNRRCDRARK